jgi:zinc/manganese transport system substrate-binding protein/manganese/iron transport system substrate-binding protein
MVYGYYADRYGLMQVGEVIPSFSTAAEPSAQAIADLEQAIKEQQVRAVFVGMGFNPTLVQRIAAERYQVSRSMMARWGRGSGETYVGYTRHNTTAIVMRSVIALSVRGAVLCPL